MLLREMTRAPSLAVIAFLALLLAACGVSVDEPTPGATATPTVEPGSTLEWSRDPFHRDEHPTYFVPFADPFVPLIEPTEEPAATPTDEPVEPTRTPNEEPTPTWTASPTPTTTSGLTPTPLSPTATSAPSSPTPTLPSATSTPASTPTPTSSGTASPTPTQVSPTPTATPITPTPTPPEPTPEPTATATHVPPTPTPTATVAIPTTTPTQPAPTATPRPTATPTQPAPTPTPTLGPRPGAELSRYFIQVNVVPPTASANQQRSVTFTQPEQRRDLDMYEEEVSGFMVMVENDRWFEFPNPVILQVPDGWTGRLEKCDPQCRWWFEPAGREPGERPYGFVVGLEYED